MFLSLKADELNDEIGTSPTSDDGDGESLRGEDVEWNEGEEEEEVEWIDEQPVNVDEDAQWFPPFQTLNTLKKLQQQQKLPPAKLLQEQKPVKQQKPQSPVKRRIIDAPVMKIMKKNN